MIAQLLERELNFSFESNVPLGKMRLYAYFGSGHKVHNHDIKSR